MVGLTEKVRRVGIPEDKFVKEKYNLLMKNNETFQLFLSFLAILNRQTDISIIYATEIARFRMFL